MVQEDAIRYRNVKQVVEQLPLFFGGQILRDPLCRGLDIDLLRPQPVDDQGNRLPLLL